MVKVFRKEVGLFGNENQWKKGSYHGCYPFDHIVQKSRMK